MHRVLIVAALLVLGAALVYLVMPKNTASPVVTPAPFVWGAYAGNAQELAAFEATAGKPVDIGATFTGFTEPFPTSFAAPLKAAGKTLLVFWEPEGSHTAVLSGKFDAAIRAFAEEARAYGAAIIMVPFNEPNLYEPDDAPTPWGFGADGNTAENFKQAWIHVREVFGEASNVKWAIAYNNVAIPADPENTIANLYPGEQYVDYVGVDGFNGYDGWQTPEEIFGDTIAELKSLNKPVYIFSVASKEDPRKAQWTSQFFAWVKANPEIEGFVWFNINKEFDWRIDSDPEALDAFRQGLNY